MQLITHTKVMSLNRITVPKAIVNILGIKEGDIIAFYTDGSNIFVTKGSIVPAGD